MRCERQPLTGLNGARNRGVAAASGELLAFLDDDTIVSPGRAQAMLEAFDRTPCAAVGGRVELGLAGPPPAWLAVRRYYLAEYDLGREGHWLEGDPVPVGANCAVRRTEFERVGGFHLGLDRIAGSLVSNGDTEFFHRLRAAGGRLWYEPAAHVIHCVPVERLTVAYFLKRHFAQGVSDELLLTIEHDLPMWRRRTRTARELARQLTPMTKTVGKDLVRGRGTLNARFFTKYWHGRISAVGMRPPRVEHMTPGSEHDAAPGDTSGHETGQRGRLGRR
jgi:cellulose synthase/poly-beta-1,6-N-acetylglucosamine synthase-like glycosyltransferase